MPKAENASKRTGPNQTKNNHKINPNKEKETP
jgi:hypothetical protein